MWIQVSLKKLHPLHRPIFSSHVRHICHSRAGLMTPTPRGRCHKMAHRRWLIFWVTTEAEFNPLLLISARLSRGRSLRRGDTRSPGVDRGVFPSESQTHRFCEDAVDAAPEPQNRTSNLIWLWRRPWSRECRLPESQSRSSRKKKRLLGHGSLITVVPLSHSAATQEVFVSKHLGRYEKMIYINSSAP